MNQNYFNNAQTDYNRLLELQNQEQMNIGYPLAMDYSTNVNQGMPLMGNNLALSPLDKKSINFTSGMDYNIDDVTMDGNPINTSPLGNFMASKSNVNLPTSRVQEPNTGSTTKTQPNNNLFGLAGQLYGSGYLGTGTSQMYSTPYYLHNLGRSIRGGEGIGAGRQGFGIVGNSLLSLASGARDILGGMGAQNIQNFLKQEGTNKKINSMRQGYGYSTNRNNEAIGYQGMQDGGQIEGSQEPNPNDIIMAYAQSKGLSEEQLNQLIQQLQGLPEEDQMMALQEMMADLQGGTEQEMMQEGGEMGGQADAQMEQLQQQVAQALQQGTDPNQVIQQLVQMGLPQDQAVAMVQQIMQALEQGQAQAQAPAPAMKRGGKVKKIIML
jgi:hypothetical protein